MMVKPTSFFAASGIVFLAVAAFAVHPARAAGPFDGIWQVKVIGAGSVTSSGGVFECPESHITLKIKDGAISGLLQRGPDAQIRDGYDAAATPLSGTVDDNGNIGATWQGLTWIGHATRNHLSLSWKGECGSRYGTGQPL